MEPLLRLLDAIHFDDRSDRLWFVGDLVNRGPQSLDVLRFIYGLPIPARITLGNHDLHLLSKLFGSQSSRTNPDDTLHHILMADDALEIGHWLRRQSILIHDKDLNIVMCHAGIAPTWTLKEAEARAQELEQALSGDDFLDYLHHMYGNTPNYWSPDLTGFDRLRVITNYFTRMRFCDEQGRLLLGYKGTLDAAPVNHFPWYAVPGRKAIDVDIVFGHWAALKGQSPSPHIHAIDTGCLWGGELTALRLQDRQRFSVPGI
jgi:bis(5'-nucleosyl)-tetraphosphatase (symmetrical)